MRCERRSCPQNGRSPPPPPPPPPRPPRRRCAATSVVSCTLTIVSSSPSPPCSCCALLSFSSLHFVFFAVLPGLFLFAVFVCALFLLFVSVAPLDTPVRVMCCPSLHVLVQEP